MLRQQISRMLVQHGLDVTPEDLIITNGSKQGLSLVVHYYVKPGESYLARNAIAFVQHGSKGDWHSHDGRGHESRVVGEKPLHLSTKTDFYCQHFT